MTFRLTQISDTHLSAKRAWSVPNFEAVARHLADNRPNLVVNTGDIVLDDPDGAALQGPTSIAWGGADMRDVYIGSILTPHVLKGRSSVPGLPMDHQR